MRRPGICFAYCKQRLIWRNVTTGVGTLWNRTVCTDLCCSGEQQIYKYLLGSLAPCLWDISRLIEMQRPTIFLSTRHISQFLKVWKNSSLKNIFSSNPDNEKVGKEFGGVWIDTTQVHAVFIFMCCSQLYVTPFRHRKHITVLDMTYHCGLLFIVNISF